MNVHSSSMKDHDRFKAVTQATDIIAWATNAAGECTYLSPSWFSFTGAEPGHGIGLSWISLIHPEDAPRVRREFFHANDTQTAHASLFRLSRARDHYSTVWAVGLPSFDFANQFVGFEGTVCVVEELQAETQKDDETISLRRLLTEREREVMRLIAHGNTSESVAAILGITARTVDTHIGNSALKLGAFNRVHAVFLAMSSKQI